ncbi:MAG: citrate/2-methylcitrate synthase [Clostridia bacterium]|nr:citrate/2-methylcitrate synthase [Clostridia bacterium]
MDTNLIKELRKNVKKNSVIPSRLYDEYNVKRGLRNENGTGVLVGLTRVGDVHGYVLDEGEKIPVDGRLRYRGVSIKELTDGFQKNKMYGFEEVCFFLLFGDLPNKEQYDMMCREISEQRELPEGFVEEMILKFPSRDIMNKLARSVLVLYSFDDNPDDVSIENVINQSIRLIAQMPLLAAYGYIAHDHYHCGGNLFINRPDPSLSCAENFLHVLRKNSKYTKLEAELLDLCLVLHAEHGGGNNSSFTTHVVSSSGTDTYSAVAASIGSLKGPKHGGANIRVMEMMEDLMENVNDYYSDEQIEDYLTRVMKKEAHDKSGLIYGFGHAVYTLSDPRAVILKEKARELAEESGNGEIFQLYDRVEKIAPEVFKKIKGSDKPVSANVDFYSGLVYKMLRIPKDLYTPIFAMARIVGWSAHRIEELIFKPRIMRPAYKNVCMPKEYIKIEDR